MNGNPLEMRADHAEFDRPHLQLRLGRNQTRYGDGAGSSDKAIVHFRPDGSAERIDAEGEVQLSRSAARAELRATSLTAALDGRSQPQLINAMGGVQIASAENGRILHARGETGRLQLGGNGSLSRMLSCVGQLRLRSVMPG